MLVEQGARRAEHVDAPVLEEAPVLGGERRLDDGVGDVLERHRVVVQDAALADLVAVLIEELDRELPGEEAALVELAHGREASANITTKPPMPSVKSSEPASLARRRQPVSLKRAKKLVPAFQKLRTPAHVSASVELILESSPSQLKARARRPCLKNQSCTLLPFPDVLPAIFICCAARSRRSARTRIPR